MQTQRLDTPQENPPPARLSGEPAGRPKLWRYCRDNDIKFGDVAKRFNRSREWVRLICLPFDDPNRQRPSTDDVVGFREWSGGQLQPGDWYPPALTPPGEALP